MFELVDNVPESAVIKVIGVGGGGGNAVKHMIANAVEGVEFVCANTDAQALADIESKTVLQLGGGITKGLGAGANPDIGRAAAALHAVLAGLNYRNLDEESSLAGKNTTTEVLAREVFERMAQQIRSGALGSAAQALVSMRVTLRESHIAWASYEGPLTDQTAA